MTTMNNIKYIIHKLLTKNKQKRNLTYDMVISLGEDCATAGHLSSTYLRNKSMPFDWIDGAPLLNRAQLIAREFQDWLHKGSLEPFEVETEVEEERAYTRYKNTITNLNFQHDFHVDVSFEDDYDNVKAKYDRRINRFQNAFKNSERILFVWIVRSSIDTDENIIQAVKILNDYSPKARVDLFYIQHDNSMDLDSFKFQTLNEHVTKFYLNNSSVDFSTAFQAFKGNIPQIIQIFWEFNLISYKSLAYNFSIKAISKMRQKYGIIKNFLREKL